MVPTRSVARRCGSAGLALALAIAIAPGLRALDSTRTLSQAVHRIWQVQQGLPEATVYAVAQGPDGYLWLGTETGLVRFDGVRFVSVDRPGGLTLPATRVQEITMDARGALWVATSDDGVLEIGADRTRRLTTADGLPSNDVRCAVAAGDRVWLCTARGLAEVAPSGVSAHGVPLAWTGAEVHAACLGPGGAVWIAGEGSILGVWNGRDYATRTLASVGPATSIRALFCAPDGDVWAGTTDGLVDLVPATGAERRLTTADGLPANQVLSLAGTRDGSLLAGTTDGFSRILHGTIDSFRAEDGLSQSTVYALFEDHEGSLWVGTKHGLNQFLDGRAVPYTTAEGLPSNDTGPIVQDARGRIWIGTIGAGLGWFDGPRIQTMTTKDGLVSDTILSLAVGEDDDLWVGTDRGLDRLHDNHVVGAWTTASGLPANRVQSLIVDRDGAVWIATAAGLARLPRAASPGTRANPALRGAVDAIGGERDARLLVAPDVGGLVSIGVSPSPTATEDPRLTKPATTRAQARATTDVLPPEATLRRVDALYQDADGAVWIGTLGDGLRLLEHGRLTSFHTRDGLFDDVIYGIVADDHDRLWMACSKGIFSVNRQDLLRVASGEARTFASTPYSPTDALRTIECKSGVQPALWRMHDGSIWFSTIRGVLTLDPAHVERRFAPPPAVIEEITVDGVTTTPRAIASLPAGVKNVEFRYTGLSFIVPTRLTFRYQLQGFDDHWIEAGPRREAFYTNLPPRHFQFRVEACTPDGTCSEAPSAVALAIAPRLYQRAWFLPVLGLSLVALGYGVYRRRIHRLRADFALVLAERARIARELHDTLVQGFAGIAMAAKALTVRLPASPERVTLEDIVSDAAECLREARRTLAGLRNPELGLAPAVEQAARQLTNGTHLTLRLALGACRCPLPASAEYHLVRIVQEAISNTVKHARARSIDVSLESTTRHVRLRIADDGQGFDGASEPPGHYGLLGMRERASQIGATLDIASTPGRGTSVTIEWTAGS